MNSPFVLPLPGSRELALARAWLQLGIAALVAAGLYSLLLVASRTPAVQEWVPWLDLFHVVLVVHVDLSVFIWFMAFASMLWSLSTPVRGGRGAWVVAAGATLLVALSPLLGADRPLLNNYIPVLDHPLFLLLLGLFAGGVLLQAILTAGKLGRAGGDDNVARFGLGAALLPLFLAAGALLWTGWRLPAGFEGEAHYEYLFWGAGHLLQFTWTALVLVAWLWLAESSGARLPLSPRAARRLLALVVAPALAAPLVYATYPVESNALRVAFTELMRWGGLATLPLAAAVVVAVVRAPSAHGRARPLRAALLASMTLFATGGVIGFLIEGVNVVIPAHYHGSIVGVTLAFMGLTCHLLPHLGWSQPAIRLATWQPWIYGGGQLMHILGLAWSGGYGVQRKTAGAAQGLDHLGEIAGMALMGLGGLVSIIGGLLFLVVVIGAMTGRRRGATD